MKAENIQNMIAVADKRGQSTRGNMRVAKTGKDCYVFTLYSTDIVRVYRERGRRKIKFYAGGAYGGEEMPNYWNTLTTRKNMNAIADALGFPARVSSKDGALYAVAGNTRLWADDVGGMVFPFPIA